MATIKLKVWNCNPGCGTKGVYGPSTTCPNCGRPRPKDVTFHSTGIVVTDPSKLEEAYKGADVVCGHCDMHNKAWDTECYGCGNPLDYSSEDESLPVYSYNVGSKVIRPRNVERVETKTVVAPKEDIYTRPRTKPKVAEPLYDSYSEEKVNKRSFNLNINWPRWILGILISSVVVLFCIEYYTARDVVLTVDNHSWKREIPISSWEEVRESDWDTPRGAFNVSSSQEIHHYDQVLDGYEDRCQTVCESVADGQDACGETCTDLGNGYESCVTDYCTTYRQDCREECDQVAVYRDEPVYDTYYQYSIMKWVHHHTEKASDNGKNPMWPIVPQQFVGSGYREERRSETYYLYLKERGYDDRTVSVSYSKWEVLNVGDTVIGKRTNIFNVWVGLK